MRIVPKQALVTKPPEAAVVLFSVRLLETCPSEKVGFTPRRKGAKDHKVRLEPYESSKNGSERFYGRLVKKSFGTG